MEPSFPAPILENPAEASVGYVLFGQSLKMQALEHVLRTFELQIVDSREFPTYVGRLKVAFDGCDPEACADKAQFIRSRPKDTCTFVFFSIGRIPRLRPLLETAPLARKHQGTIFDPEVEIFRDGIGAALHRLARFAEIRGVESQVQWLVGIQDPLRAVQGLEALLRYTSGDVEDAILHSLIGAVRSFENRLTAWAEMARLGQMELLKEKLRNWTQLTSAGAGLNPAGPLHPWRELICGLGFHGRFETTVADLAGTPVATLADWQRQIDQLP